MITKIREQYLAPDPLPVAPTFQVAVVPPGFVWTVSFSVISSLVQVAGQPDTGQFSQNNALQSIIWTMYRNGVAENCWIGLSMLCNVQLFGNDSVVVMGELPEGSTASAFPSDQAGNVPVALNVTGYSAEESEVQYVVPFVSTTRESAVNATASFPTNDLQMAWATGITTAGSTVLVPAPAFGEAIQLWWGEITLATQSAVTAAVSGVIEDAAGNIYAIASARGLQSNNQAEKDLRGIIVESFPLTFQVSTIAAPVFLAGAVVQYSVTAPL